MFENDTPKKRREQKIHGAGLDGLYAQIGRLTTQNEWLKKNLASELCTSQRRLLVDFEGTELPVSKQAELLGFNRTGLYYTPVPPRREDLDIKMRIDTIYTAHPEFGCRRICAWLDHYENIL